MELVRGRSSGSSGGPAIQFSKTFSVVSMSAVSSLSSAALQKRGFLPPRSPHFQGEGSSKQDHNLKEAFPGALRRWPAG